MNWYPWSHLHFYRLWIHHELVHICTSVPILKYVFVRGPLLLRSYGLYQQMAFTPVTDSYGKGPDQTARMRHCTRVVQMMLRTWSGRFIQAPSCIRFKFVWSIGLMYFYMDDMQAIRHLIDCLRIPSLDDRVRSPFDQRKHPGDLTRA